MIELLFVNSLLQKHNKKENFSNNYGNSKTTMLEVFYIIGAIIFMITIQIYASYLSYMCSKTLHSDKFTQMFFSFIALLLGSLYLLYYFFVNYLSGKCH